MDIHVLRNFLAIAELGNMTHAADALHISQPALSMQLKRLEAELGKQLFIRNRRRLELTPEGQLLKQRAESVIALVDKTVSEFHALDSVTGGEIRIGCAESHLVGCIARSFARFKHTYPLVQFDLFSGGTKQVLGQLASDALDLAIIVEPPHLDRYHFIKVPGEDVWGALIPGDDPLASLDAITIDDLAGRKIIISKQSLQEDLPRWAGDRISELSATGFYNLAYNGAVFAREGLGVMLSFDHLVDTSTSSGLVFRPLSPRLSNTMFVVWQKHQAFTPIVEHFVAHLKADIG